MTHIKHDQISFTALATGKRTPRHSLPPVLGFCLALTAVTLADPTPYPVIQPTGSMILDTSLLAQQVSNFAEEDRWFFGVTSDIEVSTINNGVYGGQFVKNAEAYDYLKDRIPLFDCPDTDFIRNYYFRWWTYRKHVKNLGTPTAPNLILTEFIDPVNWADSSNAINAALGHHVYEGRWLQDERVVTDYERYWVNNPAARPRHYSAWLADAALASHKVNPDTGLLTELLTSPTNIVNLETNYQKWINGIGTTGGANRNTDGLFWQNDGYDAMEVSFGGSGKRPSINSYMYGDARAIAEMFRILASGDPAKAALYNTKALWFDQEANTLRGKVQSHLWDPGDGFFKTGYNDFNSAGTLQARREQIGFTPWAFGLPVDGGAVDYDLAWSHLASFTTPVGLTSGALDETGYNTGMVGQCCRWDGPAWPFATTITLRALANLLQDYQQAYVGKSDYFQQLQTYTASHHQQFTQNGQTRTISWIDESMVSGGGNAGNWTQINVTRDGTSGNDNPRGLAYNHSGYVDLIITGLAGLRPATGELVRVSPLLPDNTWDWFLLDHVRYHGRYLTILWDRTGAKYGRGAGLKVYADGVQIASAAGLQEVVGTLATTTDTLLTSTNPPDEATGLLASATTLTAAFNRVVQPGTGTIRLMKSSGGGDVLIESFNVANSPRLAFNGATVTITPTTSLTAGGNFHILIDATAIQGSSGTYFAGISNPNVWNFSTDGTRPSIIDRSPVPGAPSVAIWSNIAFTFDEPVVKGAGNIVIRRVSDGSAVQTIGVSTPGVTVNGSAVSVDLDDLPVGTFYVEINEGAFADPSGNAFAGISGSSAWAFTTSATAGLLTTALLNEATDIINTSGILISAVHFQNPAAGDPSPLVVNGIPHIVGRNNEPKLTQNMNFEGDFRNGASGLPQGGSNILQVLLSGIAGANGITMNVSGLTVGKEYLFQSYWEANSTGQSLTTTIEGTTLNGIVPLGTPGGVLISYRFKAGDTVLNAFFDRDDVLPDGNNWLSGYSLQEIPSTVPIITSSLLNEETDIIRTGGTIISAVHFQNRTSGTGATDPSPLVVNGIPHIVGRNNEPKLTQNLSFEGDFRNGGSGLPQGGSNILQVLLSGIAGANGITMNVSGLTVGKEYLFQAYWEANSTGQVLTTTIEGATLNGIVSLGTPGGVLISYQFTAGDTALNTFFDRTDVLGGDQNNWLSGYSLQEVATTYVNWIAGYPAVGAATGFNDDPDGDRLSNGIEAWFGTHPGQSSQGITQVATSGNVTTFRHPRNPNPPGGIVGTYEWSPNLTNWYAGDGVHGPPGGATVSISAVPDGDHSNVSATASGQLGRLFLRARVIRND